MDEAPRLRIVDGDGTPMPSPDVPTDETPETDRRLREIEITRLELDDTGLRQRHDPESLEGLARSIARRGMLAPLRVRFDSADNLYRVVCGERRYHAAVLAGLDTVPCLIVDTATPADVLEERLVENLHREDLAPLEQASGYRELMTLRGWTASHLASVLGLHKGTVTRTLALLELPEAVRAQVSAGSLSPAAAYELSKLDDPATQVELADQVVAGELSRAETAELVRTERSGRDRRGPKRRTRTFTIGEGTKVVVFGLAELPEDQMLAALREAVQRLEAELAVENALLGIDAGRGPEEADPADTDGCQVDYAEPPTWEEDADGTSTFWAA